MLTIEQRKLLRQNANDNIVSRKISRGTQIYNDKLSEIGDMSSKLEKGELLSPKELSDYKNKLAEINSFANYIYDSVSTYQNESKSSQASQFLNSIKTNIDALTSVKDNVDNINVDNYSNAFYYNKLSQEKLNLETYGDYQKELEGAKKEFSNASSDDENYAYLKFKYDYLKNYIKTEGFKTRKTYIANEDTDYNKLDVYEGRMRHLKKQMSSETDEDKKQALLDEYNLLIELHAQWTESEGWTPEDYEEAISSPNFDDIVKKGFLIENPPVASTERNATLYRVQNKNNKTNFFEGMSNEDKYYYYLLGQGRDGEAKMYKSRLSSRREEASKQNEIERMQDEMKYLYDNSEWYEKVGLNIVSVPAKVFGGLVGAATDVNSLIRYGKVEDYYNSIADFGNTIQNLTEEELVSTTDNELAKTAIKYGYNLATTTAEMWLGSKFGSTGHGVLMGAGSAHDYAHDAIKRGASTEQVVVGSVLTGVAEGIFEKYSLDKIVSLSSSSGTLKTLGNLALSGVIEASEEDFTLTTQNWIDAMVMGAKSNKNIRINELMLEGKTREEAEKISAYEDFQERMWTVALAFGSGSAFYGGNKVKSNLAKYSEGKQILNEEGYDDLRSLAVSTKNEAIDKDAKDIGKALDKTERKLTPFRVGNLSYAVNQAKINQNLGDIQTALEGKGFSKKKAQKVAEEFLEVLNSEEITQKQYNAITKDEATFDVFSSLISDTDSSVNTRNLKHFLARNGIEVVDENTEDDVYSNDGNEVDTEIGLQSEKFLGSDETFDTNTDNDFDSQINAQVDMVETTRAIEKEMRKRGTNNTERAVNVLEQSREERAIAEQSREERAIADKVVKATTYTDKDGKVQVRAKDARGVLPKNYTAEERAIESFFKKRGINMAVFESESDVDGFKNGNTVYLNRKTAKKYVFKHEFSHFFEKSDGYEAFGKNIEKAVESSKTLRAWVEKKASRLKGYDKNATLSAKIGLIKNNYKAQRDGNPSNTEDNFEFYADFVMDNLYNGTDIESTIAELENAFEDKGTWQKFCDFMRRLIKQIKELGLFDGVKIAKLESQFAKVVRSEKTVANDNKTVYNVNKKSNRKVDSNVRTNEFRDLQKRSRELSDKDIEGFRRGSKTIDEGLRKNIAEVLRREVVNYRNGNGNSTQLLKNTDYGTEFKIVEDVDATLFHDTFEIVQKYLRSGDAVDLHSVQDYKNTKNYLSEDGLSGFSITKDGDLISVFSLRPGFLSTCGNYIVSKGAKTLDCFNSNLQNLPEFYNKKLGFKTASILEFNYEMLVEDKGQEYADYFVETYGKAPVAFMVNTDEEVQAKYFNKDRYEDAVQYRDSFLKAEVDTPAFSISEKTDSDYLKAVRNGDMETAQKMVDEAAEEKLKDSKGRTKDGKLRRFYHGTNNTDFYEFSKDYIGTSSGDNGFFGEGFYFAFNKGEARYYGRNVLESFLNYKNPFIFRDLFVYNGVESHYADKAVFAINFAEEFPELAKEQTIRVSKNDEIVDISFSEFKKQFDNVLNNVKFETKINKFEDGTKSIKVVAGAKKKTGVGRDGQKYSYYTYDYEQSVYDEDVANDTLNNVYSYLEKVVYERYLEIPSSAQVITSVDFSNELIKRNYDACVQSEDGDEVVVFNSNQIKSAEPVVYDDDGKVIPLSQRFNKKKSDIRFSISERATNEELASMDETALYIKNTKKANYIGMIFNGTKTEETRSRRTLDAFIGKEFYVTDGKKVYGSIILGEPHKYTEAEFHKLENQKKHRVPKGDEYDIKQGGIKWAYPIESYNKFDKPKKLSDSKEYKNSFQARQVMYSISDDFDGLVDTYGAIPEGMNAERDIKVPKRTSKNQYTSLTVRSIMEKGSVDDATLEQIKEQVVSEALSHKRWSDKEALDYAQKQLEDGEAETIWNDVVSGKTVLDKNKIAVAEVLLEMYANAGEADKVLTLTAEVCEAGRRSAQVVQAVSLLKKMGGVGRLYYLQKVTDSINRDIEKRFGKKAKRIKIEESLATRMINAKTDTEVQDASEDIMKALGEQMPQTFFDKWNAWRYLSMLGNPRTHIRNIVGNAIFIPAIKIKNGIATALEHAFIKDEGQRTKAIKVSKDVKEFAEKDFEEMKDFITSGGKYQDGSQVQDYVRVFKNRILEGARKFNFDMLEREDAFFLKLHYKNALGQFITARGLDINNLTEKQLWDAREYAVLEAQKATYRDASAVASAINRLSQQNKVANVVVEGILPFKKTPINILKRGVEYSPIGLIKTLAIDTFKKKQGKITASQYIDGISSGLTGTGIMALGYLLGSLGVAIGGMGDDEDKWFRQQNGEQEYSIVIGGHSYTVDWAAPSCIPFFIGVELQKVRSGENDNVATAFVNALDGALEPLTNLSMLQGINDTLDTIKWSDSPLTSIVSDSITSYFTQALPTLAGQMTRVADGTRYKNYVDKNSAVPEWLQQVANTVSSKTGNWGKNPYRNAWGETEVDDSLIGRIVSNLVSPGYYSKVNYDGVNEEIARLYNAKGNKLVLPDTVDNKISVNGEYKYLTADEYEQYQIAVGQSAYEYIDQVINSDFYTNADDNTRVDMIADIYTYCENVGKTTVSDYELSSSDLKVKLYLDRGVSMADYLESEYSKQVEESEEIKTDIGAVNELLDDIEENYSGATEKMSMVDMAVNFIRDKQRKSLAKKDAFIDTASSSGYDIGGMFVANADYESTDKKADKIDAIRKSDADESEKFLSMAYVYLDGRKVTYKGKYDKFSKLSPSDKLRYISAHESEIRAGINSDY